MNTYKIKTAERREKKKYILNTQSYACIHMTQTHTTYIWQNKNHVCNNEN